MRSFLNPQPCRDTLGRCLSLVSLAFVPLLLGTPAYAQDRIREIDELFSWITPDMPGCAVAVSQKGEVVVNRAYGVANLETEAPIGPSTMFDIGSVQKQFVAAAVLLLVEEGRLALSDDIREHIPELPDYGNRVTLDHLLTHTSGIRDWVALSNFSREEEDALTLILRQRGLNFAPGEEWSYSNSGYVLLKEIVGRTSGMSFSEFARTRLFEPLGMENTMYAADIRAAKTGALAYEKEGDVWKPAMMLGDERGGGAVLSTASDLLIWNEALTRAPLGEFVSEKLQEPATLSNGRELSYARGLMLDTNYGGQVVWHGGSAAGHKSVLARYPEQGLSIAILCNAGEAADDRAMFAGRIFDLFVSPTGTRPAEPGTPAALPGGTPVEGRDMNSRAGLFFSERTREPLRLVVNNGRLRVAGGPPLLAVAEDRFRNPSGTLSFRSEDEFELRFLSPDAFELVSMEGEVTRYRRAQPYAPTPDELQAFAGRYESDDLRAVFQVEPRAEGIAIQLNGSQVIEFAPVDRDTFQRSLMTVRFRRNEGGEVVALDYSNPVVRNIRFARLSDGAETRIDGREIPGTRKSP
ncbi:MAG: serine hydrolase domain-containing protein [Longimicrobiales bacterium]